MADIILNLTGADENPISLGGLLAAHESGLGTLRLESNLIRGNSSPSAMKYTGALDNNHGVKLVATAGSGSQRVRIYLRDQASVSGFTGYMIVLDFTTLSECRIKTVINGVETTRVSSVTQPTLGDEIHFYAVGQTVYYDLNSVNQASWNDTSNTYPSGQIAFGMQNAGVSYSAVTITGTAVSRSITNIDGDNNVQAGQSTSITGVGFDLPIVSVTLDGEPVTVTGTPTATNINVTIPLHINAEWGSTTNDLVVTDQTGALTLNNVTLSAPTGWETVTFTTAPDAGTTESFYELSQTDATVGNFTAATNDILAFESQTGLTVDGQTIPVVDPPSTVSGAYKWWDASLSTWTSVSSFTINDLGLFGSSSNIILRDVLKPILSSVLSNISEE